MLETERNQVANAENSHNTEAVILDAVSAHLMHNSTFVTKSGLISNYAKLFRLGIRHALPHGERIVDRKHQLRHSSLLHYPGEEQSKA